MSKAAKPVPTLPRRPMSAHFGRPMTPPSISTGARPNVSACPISNRRRRLFRCGCPMPYSNGSRSRRTSATYPTSPSSRPGCSRRLTSSEAKRRRLHAAMVSSPVGAAFPSLTASWASMSASSRRLSSRSAAKAKVSPTRAWYDANRCQASSSRSA